MRWAHHNPPTPTASTLRRTRAEATGRGGDCGRSNCKSWRTSWGGAIGLALSIRNPPMEPDRTSIVLVHQQELEKEAGNPYLDQSCGSSSQSLSISVTMIIALEGKVRQTARPRRLTRRRWRPGGSGRGAMKPRPSTRSGRRRPSASMPRAATGTCGSFGFGVWRRSSAGCGSSP